MKSKFPSRCRVELLVSVCLVYVFNLYFSKVKLSTCWPHSGGLHSLYSLLYSFIPLLLRSFVRSFTPSLVPSLVPSLLHSLVHSLYHSSYRWIPLDIHSDGKGWLSWLRWFGDEDRWEPLFSNSAASCWQPCDGSMDGWIGNWKK